MAERMRIVMLGGECVPFAKVGGLADVLGALPQELEKLGLDVSVVIPRYRSIDLARFGFERLDIGPSFDVHRSILPCSGVKVFLIGNDFFFGRDGIYTDPATGLEYPDQADRWIFFQRASMEFIAAVLGRIDVLHCHDHQTGLVPAYLRRVYRRAPSFHRTGTVFTIHNMGYQGLFSAETMDRTGLTPDEFFPLSPFEFYGKLNFMKAALVFADTVTTVSETYAREIAATEEFGYGLEGVLRSRAEPAVGILNGIDYETWDPSRDPLLAANFTDAQLEGKRANKEFLFREFGLSERRLDRPLLAMISRIDVQKGFDLLIEVLEDLLAENVSYVFLGTGNKETENQLRAIAAKYPGQASLRIDYNNTLAHRIEAGADIFLMPSKYEPCGLNQMYSMRYGTLPVVRATGGLADTVQEFDPATGEGTGFCFGPYKPVAFRDAVLRAIRYWDDRQTWRHIMRNAMNADFSWARSARRYAEVYERIVRRYALH